MPNARSLAALTLAALTPLAAVVALADGPATQPAAAVPTLPPTTRAATTGVTRAVATLAPSESASTRPTANHVTGTVTFTRGPDGNVAFVADVVGLEPNSTHGFHIHDKGDLSAPDLSSAGGHYNPTHEAHGGPDAPHHHAGDLGNLVADAGGHARLTGTVPGVSLGGANSILGRSVIVHAKADDLKSQPSGDSGGRVAGGVIESAKE